MATVQTKAPLLAVSGKWAGHIYYRTRNGLQLSSFPRLVHKKTDSVAWNQRKSAFRRCVTFWHTLTSAEAATWSAYGLRHPRTNRVGDIYYLTAYQSFIKANLPRAFNNVYLLTTPPID